MEQTKAYKDYGNSCINEIGVSKGVYDDLRKQAEGFAKKGNYGEAITQYTRIISEGKATVLDYNGIGLNFILTKQYGKAIKFLREGEKLDGTELLVKLNLAHAYLLNNEYGNAKAIYKEYQSQNLTSNLSWTKKTKQDFALFQKRGLPSSDFDRVLKLMDR
jgi:tetratricopeptide (TPR) repeat protein